MTGRQSCGTDGEVSGARGSPAQGSEGHNLHGKSEKEVGTGGSNLFTGSGTVFSSIPAASCRPQNELDEETRNDFGKLGKREWVCPAYASTERSTIPKMGHVEAVR